MEIHSAGDPRYWGQPKKQDEDIVYLQPPTPATTPVDFQMLGQLRAETEFSKPQPPVQTQQLPHVITDTKPAQLQQFLNPYQAYVRPGNSMAKNPSDGLQRREWAQLPINMSPITQS